MRVTFALFAGLLIVGAAGSSGAEPQPGITSIVASAAQLGEGWTSNRVMVLIDPLSSPKEIADPHENAEGLLRMARDLLTKEPRREAYAMLRYYGGGSGSRQTNSLVYITRWKSKGDIGDDWGRDKETKDSPSALPKVGEEVRFYQRDGLHNDITFRRGKYLICVECPTSYGVEHLKRLAEVLDSNLLKALAPPKGQGGAAFEAEGVVHFRNYLSSVETRKDPVRFFMVVSNDCWLLRLTPLKRPHSSIRRQPTMVDNSTVSSG